MPPSIRPLTIQDILAQAKAAADLGIPHEEANHFDRYCEHESHMHAAFKGAYEAHAQPVDA